MLRDREWDEEQRRERDQERETVLGRRVRRAPRFLRAYPKRRAADGVYVPRRRIGAAR